MTTKHIVRRGYDPTKRSQIDCSKGGRTLQAHKSECDINNIMKQWTKTGVISHGTAKAPVYGDVFDVPDYQAHLNQILAAQEGFDALPAEVRKVFDNDPAKFVEGVNSPEHQEILQKLGIFKDKEAADQAEKDNAAKLSPIAPPSQPLGQPLPETPADVPAGTS